MRIERRFPSIWELTVGEPERLTPNLLLGGKERTELHAGKEQEFPFCAEDITEQLLPEGVLVSLPLEPVEKLYGLGLQFQSFLQNGRRKTLRTNADAPGDTGDSHAPVPFYISSKGYGVLVDTGRNVEFDCGAGKLLGEPGPYEPGRKVAVSTEELYARERRGQAVGIFVKGAPGLTLYVFAGDTMKQVVEHYNLFCGGGVLPPMWGLGNLYRCYGPADQLQVEKLLEDMQAEDMPFSMLGLEPGWQSHSYSSSFEWDPQRFPDPERLIQTCRQAELVLNVWEQPFVHPSAKYYRELLPYSGNYEVWGGLAPDFALPEARDQYGKKQGELIDAGIGAVKLDECDGSDFTGGWFFPDFAQFPSGLNGEQEKNLYGAMGQRVIQQQFAQRNLRSYSQVRANWSYGASMGFVLYSDLYDHGEFIRAIPNAGFSGLLWSPEVRQCDSAEEFIRRLQTAVFSPLSMINAWMVPNPPWKQFDIKKNQQGELLEDTLLQDRCRELLRLRNALVPYLYEAFSRYRECGTPPFRALVLDYPEDEQVHCIDDAYMMGDSLLIAPILQGNTGRMVYLPEGEWYDFWTAKRFSGGRGIWMETENIPLFVRGQSILPLAQNPQITRDTVFKLEVRVYGENPRNTWLVEDDGVSLNYLWGEQTCYELSVAGKRLSRPGMKRYEIVSEIFFE